MQVSSDLLIWNDAHMQSRAKMHHVAVLTKKCVISNVPDVIPNRLDSREEQICHVIIFF